MSGPVEAAISEFDFRQPLPPKAVRAGLNQDGAIVIRNLLQPEDIERLREIVARHLTTRGRFFSLGRTQPNAVAHVGELEPLFSDARIIGVFETVLGPHNIIFTGHSDIHLNMLSGWHRDSGEAYGGYFKGDYFESDKCQVYKIALYLQNHSFGGGLTIRPGSHRSRLPGNEKAIHLTSRAGDAIVFDVRLLHIGHIPDPLEKVLLSTNLLLNGMDRRKQDWKFASYLKAAYWKMKGQEDRMSIFFTFGAKNEFTEQFATANMLRQNVQAGAPSSNISESLAKTLISRGAMPAGYEHAQNSV